MRPARIVTTAQREIVSWPRSSRLGSSTDDDWLAIDQRTAPERPDSTRRRSETSSLSPLTDSTASSAPLAPSARTRKPSRRAPAGRRTSAKRSVPARFPVYASPATVAPAESSCPARRTSTIVAATGTAAPTKLVPRTVSAVRAAPVSAVSHVSDDPPPTSMPTHTASSLSWLSKTSSLAGPSVTTDTPAGALCAYATGAAPAAIRASIAPKSHRRMRIRRVSRDGRRVSIARARSRGATRASSRAWRRSTSP